MRHMPGATYNTGCRCPDCRVYQRQRVAMSRKIRLREGRISHGTIGGYDDGCRCPKCRSRKRESTAIGRSKRLQDGRINHGTSAGYDDGCRCYKCALAKSERRRDDYRKQVEAA